MKLVRTTTRLLFALGILWFVTACDEEKKTTTPNPCDGVDCGDHGACVATAGTASCDCDTGYHAEGLTCVVNTGNTPAAFDSTPSADATELAPYTYDIVCTDIDGDTLVLGMDTADTCGGTLIDDGDGTGTYEFTPAVGSALTGCVLSVRCDDGTDPTVQTTAIAIHEKPWRACADDGQWLGQLNGTTDASSINGGTIAEVPWDVSYDGGIAALLALVPATPGQSATVDVQLTGVTIVATYYAYPDLVRLYLADGNGNIRVFQPQDPQQLPPWLPRTGMRISVRVTQVTNYNGAPEIDLVDGTNWVVESTDNEVAVAQRNAEVPVTAADVSTVIRVSGTLTSEGASCGGDALCYDLDYGADQPVSYRTLKVLHVGDCVTFMGPVTLYNGLPQLTDYNLDWSTSW
ncbi:MAG: hypothetical protein CVU59_07240 [Deltaproteobacteria bacterium HGW-Deltaproteobacteria-17]|nr:MAG: hypothetical protein CVU59_07240 [Deltaproteobacteria bacterium HGW-Deltaproteobacteria-17]